MGSQINIFKVAKRVIRLSGKTIKDKKNINGDVEIKITGLKGENARGISLRSKFNTYVSSKNNRM